VKSKNMSWFVAYTKSRSEFKASNFFERMGMMAYVPCFLEKRRWSDRIKKVRKPAISGYVFFKIEKLSFTKINVNPFVKNIVKNNGEVVKIKDSEITRLKEALKSHSRADICRKGDRVQIESGVFKHRTAVVYSVDKNTITLMLNKLMLKLSLKDNDVRVAG
tara:strand:+ start:501 stop:986 length:486 start_codon:yes stop_codon:yes gene_type:complete